MPQKNWVKSALYGNQEESDEVYIRSLTSSIKGWCPFDLFIFIHRDKDTARGVAVKMVSSQDIVCLITHPHAL